MASIAESADRTSVESRLVGVLGLRMACCCLPGFLMDLLRGEPLCSSLRGRGLPSGPYNGVIKMANKNIEYVEGPEAIDNFKRLASEILQANPKKKKKQQTKVPASSRKLPKSDKD
jgi:hypothetical protein